MSKHETGQWAPEGQQTQTYLPDFPICQTQVGATHEAMTTRTLEGGKVVTITDGIWADVFDIQRLNQMQDMHIKVASDPKYSIPIRTRCRSAAIALTRLGEAILLTEYQKAEGHDNGH